MKNTIEIKELRKSISNNLGGTCIVQRDLDYRLHLAKKHKNYNPQIIEIINTQPREQVLSESTPESRKLYNWCKQVGMDIQRIKMFTRLKVSKKGILYGKICPEHNTEECALDFFFDRFPTFIIMIESPRGLFMGSKKTGHKLINSTIKETLPILEENAPNDPILSELDSVNNKLWESYYSGQNVEERRNINLMNKNMPKKCVNDYNMDMEKYIFSNNKTLDEYC